MAGSDGNGFTNKEILVRLEQKVDKILDDHENRLRGLEKVAASKFRWTPVFSSLGAIAAALVAVLHG